MWLYFRFSSERAKLNCVTHCVKFEYWYLKKLSMIRNKVVWDKHYNSNRLTERNIFLFCYSRFRLMCTFKQTRALVRSVPFQTNKRNGTYAIWNKPQHRSAMCHFRQKEKFGICAISNKPEHWSAMCNFIQTREKVHMSFQTNQNIGPPCAISYKPEHWSAICHFKETRTSVHYVPFQTRQDHWPAVCHFKLTTALVRRVPFQTD